MCILVSPQQLAKGFARELNCDTCSFKSSILQKMPIVILLSMRSKFITSHKQNAYRFFTQSLQISRKTYVEIKKQCRRTFSLCNMHSNAVCLKLSKKRAIF